MKGEILIIYCFIYTEGELGYEKKKLLEEKEGKFETSYYIF